MPKANTWNDHLRWLDEVSRRHPVGARAIDGIWKRLRTAGLIRVERLKTGKYAGRYLVITLTTKGRKRIE